MGYLYQIIGTVISSVLDYDNMCKITLDPVVIDPLKTSFVPCDGRSIAGSALAIATNVQTAPDLRGKFVRGLNELYSDGEPQLDPAKADPDGAGRTAGNYQEDAFKEHNHQWLSGGGFDAGRGESVYARNDAGFNYRADCTAAGGNETRPKNVAMYFYLKIN